MNSPQQTPAPRTVVDLFDAQVRRTPDAAAVSFLGEKLTYRELNARADALAAMLRQRGVGPNVPVGIACERSFSMVTGMLAVLKAGGAYLPLDPSYPQDRLQYMLEQARTKLVLTTTALQAVVASVKQAAMESLIIDTLALDVPVKADPGARRADENDLCYVIYTSGSTGKPKGVAMGHGPLFNLMKWQLGQSKMATGARTVQFSPLSFDVSFQESFATWLSGGELVLVTDELRLEPPRFLEFLINERIERLFLPFIALQHLAEMAAVVNVYPKHLREVITAGEQLQCTPQVKAFFAKLAPCRLHNHYGPSETHVVTALELPEDPSSWPALPSIGRPIDGVGVLILDDNGQPVKQGEGELYLSGQALAQGYLHRPELTAERFVTAGGKRCYRTGDLAHLNPNGTIQFLGRIDGQVKVRGYRIELGEIEVALASYHQVKQVAVTVREDVPGDKRLVAYLVGDGSPAPAQSVMRQHLQGVLPDYMLPATYVWMDSLPRTPSGKIDRRALPKPEGQRPELEQAYAAPKTEIERQLAALWAAIIQIDQVGIHDNFFELGGNSLLAMTMLTRFKKAHGHGIPIVKLFQYPTIAGISRYLEHGDGQSLTDLLQRAQRRKHTGANDRDIAIVGMAGRFPGAANVGELWENLRAGKETTSFFKPGDLDPAAQAEAASSKDYVAARGVLHDADKFDASFFGINPREAVIMDPQQRQFLEVAWEAFEHAGYDVTSLKGSVGVFAGAHNNSYYGAYVAGRPELIDTVGAFPAMLASEKDYLATRVTHKLNLKGPGINVQTACSTSLVAVHLAVQSLRAHDCDMALAGGAAVSVPLKSGHTYLEGGMLSRDGHCRTFDADATGTVFSDGAGAVVLKRLEDATRDGGGIL